MTRFDTTLPDPELAARVAKLWPHRQHEANPMLGMLCHIGVHRWRRLDLTTLVPGEDIEFCFWCSKVKVDGVEHDV